MNFMKKHLLILILLLFIFQIGFGQDRYYIIQLKDKVGTPFSIDNPSAFLSPRSIERRSKQRLYIDETDLPVSPRYIDSLRNVPNVLIVNYSKWLNQICIQTNDNNALNKIKAFSFVKNTIQVKRKSSSLIQKNQIVLTPNQITQTANTTAEEYGKSFGQIHIHNGEILHQKGFRGETMLISIIDAGFYHYQSLPAFDSVRINHQILETYDFVKNNTEVNNEDAHGMHCFSIIAGNMPNQFIGSAPKANFLLYRSENVISESPLEEQNWIVALERSDSAGADVISTSLGYNEFDNPQYNYTYQDMNGRTSMVSKAAALGARKGMIILAAAGNEGNKPWHYIVTPGDADSILTVGAVNVLGAIGSFSSYGPSSDGRVKPTTASVGVATALSSTTDPIAYGNGTSYATPNLAGLVACLWQAFPEFTNIQIIESVKKSSSIYNTPDNRMGYGIPDFQKAYDDLLKQRNQKALEILGNHSMKVYPNPAKDHFKLIVKSNESVFANLQLADASGKICFQKSILLLKDEVQTFLIDKLPPLAKGMYLLTLKTNQSSESVKLLIQ